MVVLHNFFLVGSGLFHLFKFDVCLFNQGMMACMFNKGENCIAAGRVFVEASIHDEYVHRVVSLAGLIIYQQLSLLLLASNLRTRTGDCFQGFRQRGVQPFCGYSLLKKLMENGSNLFNFYGMTDPQDTNFLLPG